MSSRFCKFFADRRPGSGWADYETILESFSEENSKEEGSILLDESLVGSFLKFEDDFVVSQNGKQLKD